MDALSAELALPSHLPLSVVLVRMLVAAGLGALIGFEREWRNRPAGLRTHILVCLAAATFGILSIEIAHAPMFHADTIKESVRVDPMRVIEAVTAGVAFLAAGTIVMTRGEVQGLTTGAGMWLAGAVGLACGLGYWKIAGIGGALTLIVLGALYALEARASPGNGSVSGGWGWRHHRRWLRRKVREGDVEVEQPSQAGKSRVP